MVVGEIRGLEAWSLPVLSDFIYFCLVDAQSVYHSLRMYHFLRAFSRIHPLERERVSRETGKKVPTTFQLAGLQTGDIIIVQRTPNPEEELPYPTVKDFFE